MGTHAAQVLDRETILAQLRVVKPILAAQYTVSKIGIFGSVARNEATVESDIDVVVQMEPNILKRIRIKTDLKELFQRKCRRYPLPRSHESLPQS